MGEPHGRPLSRFGGGVELTTAATTIVRTRYGLVVCTFDEAWRTTDAQVELEVSDHIRKRQLGYRLAPLDGRPAHMYKIFQRPGG